jgi:hypothetical protein
MTQEEINMLYDLTILIHEHEWFGKRSGSRSREEVQEWVAKKLASCMCIYTIPLGSSWGVLCNKEDFEKYWSEGSKIKR